MRRLAVVGGVFLLAGWGLRAGCQEKPMVVEHGVFQVNLLLHAIGSEDYTITDERDGRFKLISTTNTSDRGMKRTTVATLDFGAHDEPVRLEQKTTAGGTTTTLLTEIAGTTATVHEAEETRAFAKPAMAFTGYTTMPAAVEMLMMRYWLAHHMPAKLPLLRVSTQAPPLEIKLVGHEAFQINGRMVRLTRYTVNNLLFGREVLWMNDSFRIAAVMTFAGGLPQEEVLDEYASAIGSLYTSGVRQEMLDLADLSPQAPVEAQGSYAIVGARLIDGTGAPALEHATVVLRGGRIASVGRGPAPAGMRVIHAEGKSLLPGLWEMHSHYSGVEFGPALLAAGVTTTRDCGGELNFLITIRDAIARHQALGPRMLLAGLIDSGGPLGFGNLNADTVREGVADVDFYADNHFNQIKVYTQLSPEVLIAVAAEAHRRGMTVTGHVPAAVTTVEGIGDGMDQINHLNFVSRGMRAGPGAPLDLASEPAQRLLALLKARNIVVDPTEGWAELAGHPKSVDPATFEPGLWAAPFPLAWKFRNIGSPAADADKFRERMQADGVVIKTLYDAGVPIVAGSDTGLVGYGLDRELELYVQAGMPPIAALQTATRNAARAMRLEQDSGTIEAGKRADLVLIDGNPLANISDIRKVDKVITDGRMYDAHKLGRTVGFSR